ncbi:hypothetical protein P11VFA_077 [Rhizobium phage P11VFA]|nr:hypothetical protein P11VFA_077 [Rhizobium phage P11VFA]
MTEVRSRSRPAAAPAAVQPVAPTIATPAYNRGELAGVLKAVNKSHGEGIISRGNVKPVIEHIPTGIFALDMATFGGIPQGLVTLLYGWESSGKTTLSMKAIAGAQKKYPSKAVTVIDIEGTFDMNWARNGHGVDTDSLVYVSPSSGEQALDIADGILRAEETSLILVDSLAALIPTKELEKSFEDGVVGEQARLIGRFVRKVQQAVLEERRRGHAPAIILVNQWRYKVGVMHGDPRTLPGGMAQHYVAGLKIDIKNKEKAGRDDRNIEVIDYNEHSFTIAKNKMGNGIRTGEFEMIRNPSHWLGPGFIDDAKTVVSYAIKMGLVGGSGGRYTFDGLPNETFRKYDDIAEYMYQDLDFFDATKHRLISLQRIASGLEGTGWYVPESQQLLQAAE